MTNEEIKKKICKIIADNYLPKEMPDRLEDYKPYRFERAADALIAAGLTFEPMTFRIVENKPYSYKVKNKQEHIEEMANIKSVFIKTHKRISMRKHELRSKIEYIHEQDEVIKEYKHRAEVYYEALLSAAAYGDTPPDYYIEQAEKELAEEGKNE